PHTWPGPRAEGSGSSGLCAAREDPPCPHAMPMRARVRSASETQIALSKTPADRRACFLDLFEGPDPGGTVSASIVFCRIGGPAPKQKWLPHAALTRYLENCFASIKIVY